MELALKQLEMYMGNLGTTLTIEEVNRMSWLLQYIQCCSQDCSHKNVNISNLAKMCSEFVKRFTNFFENDTYPVDKKFVTCLEAIENFFEVDWLVEGFVPILGQYMEIILDPSVHYWTAYEIVISLNKIFAIISNPIKHDFFREHSVNVYKLMGMLCTCGDFCFQEAILKLIIRLHPDINDLKLTEQFFPDDPLRHLLLITIRPQTFNFDARTFLNVINERNKTVFSTKAVSVMGDSSEIEPPEFYGTGKGMWIDFNLKSESISFHCASNSMSSGLPVNYLYHETVFIYKKVVEMLTIKNDKKSLKLIIDLSSKMSTVLLSSKHFTEKCRSVKLVLEKNTHHEELINRYLPNIFGDLLSGSFPAMRQELCGNEFSEHCTNYGNVELPNIINNDVTNTDDEEIILMPDVPQDEESNETVSNVDSMLVQFSNSNYDTYEAMNKIRIRDLEDNLSPIYSWDTNVSEQRATESFNELFHSGTEENDDQDRSLGKVFELKNNPHMTVLRSILEYISEENDKDIINQNLIGSSGIDTIQGRNIIGAQKHTKNQKKREKRLKNLTCENSIETSPDLIQLQKIDQGHLFDDVQVDKSCNTKGNLTNSSDFCIDSTSKNKERESETKHNKARLKEISVSDNHIISSKKTGWKKIVSFETNDASPEKSYKKNTRTALKKPLCDSTNVTDQRIKQKRKSDRFITEQENKTSKGENSGFDVLAREPAMKQDYEIGSNYSSIPNKKRGRKQKNIQKQSKLTIETKNALTEQTKEENKNISEELLHKSTGNKRFQHDNFDKTLNKNDRDAIFEQRTQDINFPIRPISSLSAFAIVNSYNEMIHDKQMEASNYTRQSNASHESPPVHVRDDNKRERLEQQHDFTNDIEARISVSKKHTQYTDTASTQLKSKVIQTKSVKLRRLYNPNNIDHLLADTFSQPEKKSVECRKQSVHKSDPLDNLTNKSDTQFKSAIADTIMDYSSVRKPDEMFNEIFRNMEKKKKSHDRWNLYDNRRMSKYSRNRFDDSIFSTQKRSSSKVKILQNIRITRKHSDANLGLKEKLALVIKDLKDIIDALP